MEIDSRSKQRKLAELTRKVVFENLGIPDPTQVILGVSNRHVHLSAEDFAILFGKDAELTVKTWLRQTGEFAANETVTVIGPKGKFAKVRLMGPHRKLTQVELSYTDCYQLGISPVVCESGFLEAASAVDIEGPLGRIHKPNAAMVAGRHIHLSPADATSLGVVDGERISIEFSGRRGGLIDNFKCRVKDNFCAEVHIDMDEANGLGARTGDMVRVIRNEK